MTASAAVLAGSSVFGASTYIAAPGYNTTSGGITAGSTSGAAAGNSTDTKLTTGSSNPPSVIGEGSYYSSMYPTTSYFDSTVGYYFDPTITAPTPLLANNPHTATNYSVTPNTTATVSGQTAVYGINASGTIVGNYTNYNVVGATTYTYASAAYWTSANPTAYATPLLGDLTNASGSTTTYAASAYFINTTGAIVGTSSQHVQTLNSGGASTGVSTIAVYWSSASPTVTPTDLGTLGVSSGAAATASSTPYAFNDSGTVVGTSSKYDSSGNSLGSRAVAWFGGAGNTPSTMATELGDVATTASVSSTYTASSGFATGSSAAFAVNKTNTAAGKITLYVPNTPAGTTDTLGSRPVVWSADGSTPTLLYLAPTNFYSTPYTVNSVAGSYQTTGNTASTVIALNDNGDAVGQVNLYPSGATTSGSRLASEPVLWKSATNTTAYTPLQLFGTPSNVNNTYAVTGLNNSDISVGNIVNNAGQNTAVVWNGSGTVASLFSLDGAALNATTTGGSFTSFASADSITNDDYISGFGTFVPTTGSSYTRAFVVSLDPTLIPEPASVGTLTLIAATTAFARRKRQN